MKVSEPINWRASDPQYIDLYLYITCDDGSEWMFTLSYDYGNGRVYEIEPQYAADQEDSFDTTDKDVPEKVLEEFNKARPAMEARLLELAGVTCGNPNQ